MYVGVKFEYNKMIGSLLTSNQRIKLGTSQKIIVVHTFEELFSVLILPSAFFGIPVFDPAQTKSCSPQKLDKPDNDPRDTSSYRLNRLKSSINLNQQCYKRMWYLFDDDRVVLDPHEFLNASFVQDGWYQYIVV